MSSRQSLIWFGGATLLAVTFRALGPIMTPVIVGAGIVHFVDPQVCRLDRGGLPRTVASACLVLLVMTLILAAVVVLMPVLAVEMTGLVRSNQTLYRREAGLAQIFHAISRGEAGNVLDDLLLDWQRLLATGERLVPRANLDTTRRRIREIVLVLSGYVRGRAKVRVILAACHAACPAVTGLSYGFLIGIIAGLISLVLCVGAMIGRVLAIGVALGQLWGELFIALVAVVFLIG